MGPLKLAVQDHVSKLKAPALNLLHQHSQRRLYFYNTMLYCRSKVYTAQKKKIRKKFMQRKDKRRPENTCFCLRQTSILLVYVGISRSNAELSMGQKKGNKAVKASFIVAENKDKF